MQHINGHVVYQLLLARHTLSILQHCYRFVFVNLENVAHFDDFVLGELDTLVAVLPILVADLGLQPADVIYCSDSSLHGYALHKTAADAALVAKLTEVREVWRFKEARPVAPAALSAQSAAFAAQRSPADLWALAQRDADAIGREDTLARTERLPPALRHDRELDPHGPEIPAADEAAVFDASARTVDGGDVGCQSRELAACLAFGPASVPDPDPSLWTVSAWERVIVGAWRQPDKIHCLEARIALEGLRHAASSPNHWNHDHLSFGDNMPEVLATENGHAKDYALNATCRRSSGL